MSKLEIKAKFKPLINSDISAMNQEGLLLAGMAVLLDDIQKLEPTWAQSVKEFQHLFLMGYPGRTRLLPKDISEFRIARSIEEHQEYVRAEKLEDKLDAIIDHIYILLGTAHLHGFTPTILAEAFRRVHSANMSKVRASKENPGKYHSAHDIVKPPGWRPPDLSDLIANDTKSTT